MNKKTGKKKNPHLGSSFEDFLEEDGILEQATTVAQKRVFAYQIKQAMKQAKLTKPQMSKRMDTSRSALDRLLDSENGSVTLNTMNRAANAVGKKLKVELVDA